MGNLLKGKGIAICLSFTILLSVFIFCNVANAADVNVTTFAELKAAIQNDSVNSIHIATNINIEEKLTVSSNKLITSASGKKLTIANEDVESMFVVNNGKNLTINNTVLDGADLGRHIIANHDSTIELNGCTLINGSTDKFKKKIESGTNKQNYSGGSILALSANINIDNTVFENNSTKKETPKQEITSTLDLILAPHGGAIMSSGSIINIKGSKFIKNHTGMIEGGYGVNGEGGAIKLENNSILNINDESVIDKNTTLFDGNYLGHWSDNGGLQGGSIEATESVANIYGTSFVITGPFNTGGAIKYEGSKGTIKNSDFKVADNKGAYGVAGGAITSQNSNLDIIESSFATGKGSYVIESGGLIQVVGGGTFNLKKSMLQGSGIGWNATGANKTAKYGGAIVFYDHSSVKALIEDTTINNFTAEISGGGIALNTQIGKGLQNGNIPASSVDLTIRKSNITNNVVYSFSNTAYGGGIYNGAGNKVLIEGGEISSSQYSSTGAGIYNEGSLTVTGTESTGAAHIINNKAYSMAGGILNDGYLKIDNAVLSGNVKGDYSNLNQHVYNTEEKAGANIYAVKDVIITPRAVMDGGDVRVLDGQSAILLTGSLTNRINVSISEKPKSQPADTVNNPVYPLHPKFNEPMERHIGYVVAKGTDNYTPNESDAKFLHYDSKDTSQTISEYDDHKGVGAWDYVLDPDVKNIVLGQRAKMVYHSNGTDTKPAKFETSNDKKEQLYVIYSSSAPWSTPKQMTELTEKPVRNDYMFSGWYYNVASTNEAVAITTNNENGIQNIHQPANVKQHLIDFNNVKFTKQENGNITSIVSPYIINTYAGWIQSIDIPVEKVWVDTKENEKQPVKINLLADGIKVDTITLDGNASDANKNWKGVFEDKAVFNSESKPIKYTVTEDALEGFKTEISPNAKDGLLSTSQLEAQNTGVELGKFIITNTKINKFNLKVNKIWQDEGNIEGFRPDSVNVTLVGKVGNDIVKQSSVSITKTDAWEYTFNDLLLKTDDGKDINYSLTETKVNRYNDPVITPIKFDANDSSKATATITNTRNPELTTVKVNKVWNDAENQDGIRPDSINVLLKNGDNTVSEHVLTKNENWTYTFTNLPKYANGQEIAYTVDETMSSKEYTKMIKGSVVDGFTLTNSYTPKTMDIEVEKIWNDANNQDGKRPASIKVILVADEVDTNKTITISDNGNGVWKASFKSLPVYKNGKKIVYTIREDSQGLDDYVSSVDSYKITNSYTPEKMIISGQKTWNDNNNQDGKRPTSIIVYLMNGDIIVDTVTVRENDNGEWLYSFKEVDKYANGRLINYTVVEKAVPSYTAAYENYNITNTHQIEKINIDIAKIWKDQNDADKLRPESIIVYLFADDENIGEYIISKKDNWSKRIEGLDKYKQGKEIKYTVREQSVKNYDSKVDGDMTEGFIVTNTHKVIPKDPKTTTEKGKPGVDKNIPNTNDESNMNTYLLIMVISLLSIFLLRLKRER
ncbi:MAG: Cna B-type domain-containing protein [Eubacteriales bacterium]|nr:Cna B-type domain-containing protein [Eubacteriales bacterium]MDY3333053.1 Cna B-type domain-containing protein [Gallibacter sp.]